VSFTTPDWNISRNKSQRTSQNEIASRGATAATRRFDWYPYRSGATKTDRKPASNNKISLKKYKISEYDGPFTYSQLLHILTLEKSFSFLGETTKAN
jgi:hypothetical protein